MTNQPEDQITAKDICELIIDYTNPRRFEFVKLFAYFEDLFYLPTTEIKRSEAFKNLCAWSPSCEPLLRAPGDLKEHREKIHSLIRDACIKSELLIGEFALSQINLRYAVLLNRRGQLRVARLSDQVEMTFAVFKVLFRDSTNSPKVDVANTLRGPIGEFWLRHPRRLQFDSPSQLATYLAEKRAGVK